MTDSYNQKNINLLGDGAAAAAVLVYSPGNPGPLASNEFTDWATLISELATLGPGQKWVQIDDAFGGPFPGPAVVPDSSGQPGGKWDMNDAWIVGDLEGNQLTLLQFADGAKVFNLQGFANGILIRSISSQPVIELGGAAFQQRGLAFNFGLMVTGSGAAPLIFCASTPAIGFLPCNIVFYGIGGIADFGPPYAPLIDVAPAVALDIVWATNSPGGVIDPSVLDWLSSDVTSTVGFALASDANASIDFNNMPSHLGTSVVSYDDSLERPFTLQDLTANAILPRVGYVIATAGGAATLQAPHLAAGPLFFKNSTGGPVTVSPAAGTVNGGVSVAVADGSVQQFKSDGSVGGDWQTWQ
jgi:hypothetical protein